jgi:hypothetical protein
MSNEKPGAPLQKGYGLRYPERGHKGAKEVMTPKSNILERGDLSGGAEPKAT